MESLDLILIISAFFLSIAFTLFSIKRLSFLGILSSDLHKKEKPKKPKIGGIGIATAFSIAAIIAYILKGSFGFLIILLAFLTEATIGLMDDLLRFGPKRKLVLAGFGAIPLLLFVGTNPTTILFLFAAVTIASNWTNMLAGFNGLESGLAAIMLFFLAINTKAQNTELILLIYAAVLFGFLLLNKYPAKIFPGDSGTLPVGTVLVAATLLGAPFYKLAILFIPHFADAVLKFATFGFFSSAETRPTNVSESGFLKPDKSYLSLSRVILTIKPLREWELVIVIWLIEIIFGLVTLLV